MKFDSSCDIYPELITSAFISLVMVTVFTMNETTKCQYVNEKQTLYEVVCSKFVSLSFSL